MLNKSLLHDVSDGVLVNMIGEGDESAFEMLYTRYAEGLMAFAASRLGTIEEARDIIHDLFVHFWEQRQETGIHTNVRGFLFAAVRYRIIDHIRKASVRERYQKQLNSLPEMVSATEEELEAKELEIKIRELANDLSPRVREVFLLSRFEFLMADQIAARMGTSTQTVKNQLTTAISYIRSRLMVAVGLLLLLCKKF